MSEWIGAELTLWCRFRDWPWWWQAFAWAIAWPVPLALWAAARPREQRLGPVLLAAASLAVWVAAAGASAESRPDQRAAGGRVVGTTTSSPSTSSTMAATKLETTTTSSEVTPTTQVEMSTTTATTTTTTTISAPPSSGGGGMALLARLRVAPEGSRTGYSRDLFRHWIDADGDRCDAREEVLIAESRTPAQVDPYGCRVVAGDWFSIYDGVTTDEPGSLDIDHVVALAEAWDSGAFGWDTARRRAFANDLDEPRALIAVTASSNRSKSDDDPAEWRPSRREAWCNFATDWMTVKVKWDLSADEAEVGALRHMLATC